MPTLPCMSEDDCCHLPKPCRAKREVVAGMRDVAWILERGRCQEMVNREEGWKDIEV